MIRARAITFVAACAVLCTMSTAASAQQSTAVPEGVPSVGQMAPDFSVPGATRYGLLRDPVRLADFRGQTVVIAFFIRARTKG